MRRNRRLMMIAAVAACALVATPAAAAGIASKSQILKAAPPVERSPAERPPPDQIVSFDDRRLRPVRIMRGTGYASGGPGTAEIVSFAHAGAAPVRVMRGGGPPASAPAGPAGPRSRAASEIVVAFADPHEAPVTVLRGARLYAPAVALFAPGSAADLDRVAFAVDGAESSHGADPRMWRPEFEGPQGPMQVTAAAAFDLGGGDRFDLDQNRLLGRAYLARLYGRYGNWPDAIAAYNWGPGSLDAWIGEGRRADRLPLEVERYRDRVLRETGLATSPSRH